MTHRKLFDLLSIACGALGAIFLFISIQIIPSNINVIHQDEILNGVATTMTTWCADNQVLFQFSEPGNGTIIGETGCPASSSSQPVALLIDNSPFLGGWGLGMVCLGFVLQIVNWWPESKLSRAEWRRQQK
jgi:hypothetical protein